VRERITANVKIKMENLKLNVLKIIQTRGRMKREIVKS